MPSQSNPTGANQVLKKVFIEATNSLRTEVASSVSNNKFVDAGSTTPKEIILQNSNTLILALNLARVYTHIINKSSLPVWIQYIDDAVVGKGIRLQPNSLWKITAIDLFQGRICGIAGSPATIEVFEGVI